MKFTFIGWRFPCFVSMFWEFISANSCNLLESVILNFSKYFHIYESFWATNFAISNLISSDWISNKSNEGIISWWTLYDNKSFETSSLSWSFSNQNLGRSEHSINQSILIN